MADDPPWAAGKRRWPVWIGRRDQQPNPASAGIVETLVESARVWANIVPIGAITFYETSAVDTPVTHRIWVRWMDWVDTRHVVLRDTLRPDGSTRRELFRVRRVAEDQGRKRYLMIEGELERSVTVPAPAEPPATPSLPTPGPSR